MIPWSQENIDKLKRIVCEEKNIDPEMLLNKTRIRAVVESRQLVAYYLYHYFVKQSLQRIGDQIHKDYSTVPHCLKVIDNLKETNKDFARSFVCIEKKVLLLKQGNIRRRTVLHPYPCKPKRGILRRSLNRRMRLV